MTKPQAPSSRRLVRYAFRAALVLTAVAVAVAFVSFRSFVETSPRFCATCHVVAPEIAMWTESEHRAVRCQQCHHQSLEDGLRILKVYLAGGALAGRHAPVDLASCAACHATHDTRWPSIANSVGHRVHTEKAKLECTSCHGRQMHFNRPPRSTCLTCHEGKSAGTAHEEAHCLACHNFLSTGDELKPTRAECLGCHERQERPVVVSSSAPMQFSCYACHRPHQGGGLVTCSDCHKPRDLAGLHAAKGHEDCATCHQPHDWRSTKAQCFACHKDKASHHPEKSCSECHGFEAGLRTGP